MTGKDIKGELEVITGPMFSGKSSELIRRIRVANIAEQKVIIFKHSIDDRYDKEHITTHDGERVKSIAVSNVSEILNKLKNVEFDVVAIDEAQFFGEELVSLCKELVKLKYRVIVAGLDMDFRGEPFTPIPDLLAIADKIIKLKAVCSKCKGEASLTQRFISGKYAKYSDPVLVVGAKNKYEARCRNCHVVESW